MAELGPSPVSRGEPQLRVAEARDAIARALQPIAETELVPLPSAHGRILAQDLISPIDVPAHDNSAMDGYAFDGRALVSGQPTTLRVAGTVMAGAPFKGLVGPAECLRIMTGAVMPDGLDTVVPLELCEQANDQVSIAAGVLKPGENRRLRGEDLSRGRPALAAGRRLQAADLGLLASLGVIELTVMRRLRVALFSTGDEIRSLGQALSPGCVYDANRYSLQAALQRLAVEVTDLGVVPDDPQALQATLEHACRTADAVLTSGGVSMGDADYTREVLARMGQVSFWKVAMRPGRPFAFGPLSSGDTTKTGAKQPVWLFALPGNPVAALVSFYVFVQDALLQLAGARQPPRPTLRLPSATAIRKRPGRTEFQRAICEPGPDGVWRVRLTGSQGAGVLRSMSEANALVVLGHDQGSIEAGEPVNVWLFDGLT